MLALQERHGVEIGTAYRSDREGAIFADFIAFSITAALKCKIDSVNFISTLADGSTDAAIIDQEAVFARYLDTDPSGLDLVKISTNFVSIEDV